jgi:hypothetical protein
MSELSSKLDEIHWKNEKHSTHGNGLGSTRGPTVEKQVIDCIMSA